MSTKITASSRNLLRSSVYSVLGTTSTGYGAGLVSRDVSVGQTITASDYRALIDDLRRCWIHQTGRLDGFLTDNQLPTQGSPVTSAGIVQLIDEIGANKHNTVPSQQLKDSLASSTSTIYENNTLTYEIDHSFRDAADANYFFNLGGSISAELSRAGGTYTGNTATWAGFIDWANSQISSVEYTWLQWNPGGVSTTIDVTYTSSTNYVVRLNIYASSNKSIRSVLTVTNVASTVSIPTTATSIVTYSDWGPSVQGYYGVPSPRPQATVITSFGSGQTPPTIPTKILTSSQPTDFTFPSDSNSQSQLITIRNIGNSTCTVTSIVYPAISNITTDVAYSGDDPPPWSINPGGTRTFDLRYFGSTGLVAGTYNSSFSVYSDAIVSPVTVNTRLVVTAPVFDFYLDPTTWNYTYTHRDSRSVTRLVKINGKGEFTTVNYVTDANFSARGFFIRDSSVYVGFDFTFTPPIGLTNGTYSTTVDVVINSVTHSFTATIILAVPAAPVNRHLGDWLSAYQQQNGVIGASYDIINDAKYITIGFGMGADGGGNIDDTLGANVDITNLGIGANADANFALGPVLYPGPNNTRYNYSNFLKPYDANTNRDGSGAWVNDTGWSPVDIFVARTYTFSTIRAGTHYYRFAVDNQGYFTVDGNIIGDLRSDNVTLSPVNGTFDLSAGSHKLTIYMCNVNNGYYDNVSNPGAIALEINDPVGITIWETNFPIRRSYNAYQYWNEVCRIPLYDSTATDATYYSKNYLIKNLNPLNGYSYGSYFGETGTAAAGSMFTVTQDTRNNITIVLNPKTSADTSDITTSYARYLFYYYASALGNIRVIPRSQLETDPGAGNPTRYFTGFSVNGSVTTIPKDQPTLFTFGTGSTGGGGGCPDPATPITVSESGYTRPAGQLIVGNRVWTRHETTGEFNSYPITFAGIIEQPRVSIQFDDGTAMIVSDTHKFLMWDLVWKQVFQLIPGDVIKGLDVNKTVVGKTELGVGPVVKITVDRAHTYIAAGLISHNKQDIDTNLNNFEP
jgi:hypothetical protein